jgi:hypothetical protein
MPLFRFSLRRVNGSAHADLSDELPMAVSRPAIAGWLRVNGPCLHRPGSSSLVHRLERTGESFCPGANDERGIARADGSRFEMVVPIGGGERRLFGFLALGPKHSEETYSSKEQRLLELAAAQVLVVNDNADLRRRDSEAQRVRAGVRAM